VPFNVVPGYFKQDAVLFNYHAKQNAIYHLLLELLIPSMVIFKKKSEIGYNNTYIVHNIYVVSAIKMWFLW
jgi:hypothetical protein